MDLKKAFRRWYRGAVLASIAWLLGAAAPVPHSAKVSTQAEDLRSAGESLRNIEVIIREQAERASGADAQTKPCKPGDDDRNSDLCAQWKAADAAKLAAWLSGASFAAVLGALALAYRANRISRQSMEAQGRAWVAIDHVNAVGFRMTNMLPRFVFNVRFENIGTTPAINLRYYTALTFSDDPRAHVDETIKQFENGTIDWIEANLFPHRPFERRVSCDHEGDPPIIAKTHLYIVACYKTVFSEESRYTAVMHHLQDSRRTDGLIDYARAPFGEYLLVGSPEQFVGYAT